MKLRGKWVVAAALTVLVIGAGTAYYFWDQHPAFAVPFLPGVEIEPPDGFALTRDEGLDFDVYHLTPIDQRAPPRGTLGIYVGHYPNSFRPNTGCGEAQGALCGKTVKWFTWEDKLDDRTIFHREAYCTFGRKLGGTTIHAFISSEDPSQVRLLQDCAGTVRVVRERKELARPATRPEALEKIQPVGASIPTYVGTQHK